MKISEQAREFVWNAEHQLDGVFQRIDSVESVTQMRVLEAFQNHGVAVRHFAPTTGYGYDDIGRDTLDLVFADALQAEAALVRPQFVNGTHAIFTALAGLTEPGDAILSITGSPYDTLEEAIGIRGDASQSLSRFGVTFEQIPLLEDGKIDLPAVLRRLQKQSYRIIYVQRSRGYGWRPSIDPRELEDVFAEIQKAAPDAVIVVDNCYGEFTTAIEPTAVGAHVIAGSLIKNPGGGLAPTGGYVAGKSECIERIAQRFTLPGMGREVGSYAGDYRLFYQGLFLAPHTVAQCLKSAALFACVFERLGYETLPASTDVRSDIIQSVRFQSAQELIAFCQCIQAAAPIDSFAVPQPWDMPGYAHQVIMAAGAFVQGATTELSADAPICEPYTAYLQGALTYAHGRIAAMLAYDALTR
ncbi:MAG: methionine gamma-lyase family protein [bacterium]|nr:methionine gamma-lyase family protein [bacterium]